MTNYKDRCGLVADPMSAIQDAVARGIAIPAEVLSGESNLMEGFYDAMTTAAANAANASNAMNALGLQQFGIGGGAAAGQLPMSSESMMAALAGMTAQGQPAPSSAKGPPKHVCPTCGKGFKSVSWFEKHVATCGAGAADDSDVESDEEEDEAQEQAAAAAAAAQAQELNPVTLLQLQQAMAAASEASQLQQLPGGEAAAGTDDGSASAGMKGVEAAIAAVASAEGGGGAGGDVEGDAATALLQLFNSSGDQANAAQAQAVAAALAAHAGGGGTVPMNLLPMLANLPGAEAGLAQLLAAHAPQQQQPQPLQEAKLEVKGEDEQGVHPGLTTSRAKRSRSGDLSPVKRQRVDGNEASSAGAEPSAQGTAAALLAGIQPAAAPMDTDASAAAPAAPAGDATAAPSDAPALGNP